MIRLTNRAGSIIQSLIRVVTASPDSTARMETRMRNYVGVVDEGTANELASLLELVTEQLNVDADATDEPLLIDRVGALLLHPYSQNYIAGSVLTQLRKALLRPSERATLRDVRAAEMYCLGCGHLFGQQEAATIVKQGGEVGLQCFNCHLPSVQTCSVSGCASTIAINDRKVLTALTPRKQCAEHSATPATPAVEAVPARPWAAVEAFAAAASNPFGDEDDVSEDEPMEDED